MFLNLRLESEQVRPSDLVRVSVSHWNVLPFAFEHLVDWTWVQVVFNHGKRSQFLCVVYSAVDVVESLGLVLQFEHWNVGTQPWSAAQLWIHLTFLLDDLWFVSVKKVCKGLFCVNTSEFHIHNNSLKVLKQLAVRYASVNGAVSILIDFHQVEKTVDASFAVKNLAGVDLVAYSNKIKQLRFNSLQWVLRIPVCYLLFLGWEIFGRGQVLKHWSAFPLEVEQLITAAHFLWWTGVLRSQIWCQLMCLLSE